VPFSSFPSQAAGLIPLSHASAGPLLDIIVPYKSLPTGFHAIIPREFADRLEEIFDMPAEKREEMRKRTRESVEVRFGVEVFEKGWEGMWKELCEERERLAAEAEKEAKEAKEGKKKR
jgi:alpha-1,2-mannosyltransferase